MSLGSLALSTVAIGGVVAGVSILISNLSSSSISSILITNNESTDLKRVYEIKDNGDIEDQEAKDFLKEVSKNENKLIKKFKKTQEQKSINEDIANKYQNILSEIDKLKNPNNTEKNRKKLEEIDKQIQSFYDKLDLLIGRTITI